MKLKTLLQDVAVLESNVDENTPITAVVSDTRKEIPAGSLFVALGGFAFDGNRFIPMALEKGAAVIVTAKKPDGDVPYVLVEDDRLALARISAAFYGHPADAMQLIGVTGTNGKTSVTWMLKQVLEACTGEKVGLIGTMENHIGDCVEISDRTTPESIELQRLLARMRDAGCRYVVMEVSSHAIALHRVEGISFAVGAFTNLTEDHLDFHKTMENYGQTKAKLFERCACAVINADSPWGQPMVAGKNIPVLTTAVDGQGEMKAESVCYSGEGLRFTVAYRGEKIPVRVAIPGKFTVYNVLTVLAVAAQLGVAPADAARALETVRGVKGRVEVVPTPGRDFTVLIDYAHTPDGLENVLNAVRGFCKGRLIAVFGCGGDRDRTKRPIMGAIGVKIADIAIITSDNPRTEAPDAIIRDILAGVGAAKNCITIENRIEAIRYAIRIAQKDDILVLAGKGHETYQEVMGVKHHMDEREIVASCLEEE